jgi:hypothetical protein
MARYFTGKPCHKGHISERYVTSGTCIDCQHVKRMRTINAPNVRYADPDPKKFFVVEHHLKQVDWPRIFEILRGWTNAAHTQSLRERGLIE